MLNRIFYVAALLLSISSQNLYADDHDTALTETQNCLRNRNCEAAGTPAGKAADQQALAAVGNNPANRQALYNISADIMPILLQQSAGDPDKMLIIMQQAQSNPEGFFNSLPPEIQARIKSAAAAMPQ
jgi:hypothetical protein